MRKWKGMKSRRIALKKKSNKARGDWEIKGVDWDELINGIEILKGKGQKYWWQPKKLKSYFAIFRTYVILKKFYDYLQVLLIFMRFVTLSTLQSLLLTKATTSNSHVMKILLNLYSTFCYKTRFNSTFSQQTYRAFTNSVINMSIISSLQFHPALQKLHKSSTFITSWLPPNVHTKQG